MSHSRILLCGGTHGNELSGIALVNNCIDDAEYAQSCFPQSQVEIDFLQANAAAVTRNTRFCEADLNRQFDSTSLAMQNGLNQEHALALELNRIYGPKDAPQYDLVIDIHNSTANMGSNLILLAADEYNRGLARFVHSRLPDVKVTVEDHVPFASHPYLCTIGKRGVMVEIGPQPQGILRAKAYQQSLYLSQLIVQYEALVQQNKQSLMAPIEAYQWSHEVSFPQDEQGNKTAMIHPDLQDNDFKPLKAGDPIFIDKYNKVTYWQGDVVYPHFIGEAAYYRAGIAFAVAKKIRF